MKKQHLVIGVMIAFGLIGLVILALPFTQGNYVNVADNSPPLHYPGFQTWPTPRTFDGPGTIFSLDGDTFIPRGRVSSAPILAGDEVLGNIQTSLNWKRSLVEEFLGKAIRLEGKTGGDLQVRFEAGGAQRWRSTATKDDIFAWWRRAIEDGIISFNSKRPLYFIAESISVRSINYKLVNKEVRGGSIKAPSAQVEGTDDSDDYKVLARDFKEPYYIFYRPQRIEVFLGMNRSGVDLEDIDRPLRWNREEKQKELSTRRSGARSE